MHTPETLCALPSPYPMLITEETRFECPRPVFTVAELRELRRWTNHEAMTCLYDHKPVLVPECLIRFACSVANQWPFVKVCGGESR